MRTRRRAFDFSSIKVHEYGLGIPYRGEVVTFTRYTKLAVGGARAGKSRALLAAVEAIKRAGARASARGTVGRIESVRFIEGGKMLKKTKALSLAERVARLETAVNVTGPEWVSSSTIGSSVHGLLRRVHDLEARAGDPGMPKYLFEAELSCGKTIKVVARHVEEALARAQQFLDHENHDGQVVRVQRALDEAVDVC